MNVCKFVARTVVARVSGVQSDVESDLLVLEIGICTPCHEYNDALLMALLSCTVRAVWPCKGRASATQPVV